MNKLALAAVIGLSCFASAAQADERAAGSAAIGAVSGAVILGPVGAVAGAAIGYIAGASAKSSKPKRTWRPARRPVTASAGPRPQSPETRRAAGAATGSVAQEPRKAAPAGRPDPATPAMQGFE